MAKNINRLLSKKGWTGEEVGKALVASVIHDIKHKGDPDYKPLFKQEDFDRMDNSINTEYDYLVYGVYRDLYTSILDAYNRGQAIFQQFYNGYFRFLNLLTNCRDIDEAQLLEDSHPLIMTQGEYSQYREQAVAELSARKMSFIDTLFYFLMDFRSKPASAPAHIRELIEATKEETLTNQRILGGYNRKYGQGYYQLPDGRRSDQLSRSDWRKALDQLFIETHKLYINGELATPEQTRKHFNSQRQIKAYKLLYEGIDGVKALYKEKTGEDLEIAPDEEALYLTALDEYLGVRGIISRYKDERGEAPINSRLYDIMSLISRLIDNTIRPVWHYYDTPPQLTKYEQLESLEDYTATDSKEQRALYKEFKADYPALSSALEAYIKETVPAFSDFKPTQYYKDAISWGELAELNILDFKEAVRPDGAYIEDYIARHSGNDYRRINRLHHGIAIIQEPTQRQLDEEGRYLEDDSPLLSFEDSLDDIAENTHRREIILAFQENLYKPALSFLFSHNILMEIVGTIYDIDDIEVMKIDTQALESQLKACNEYIYFFYGNVYGDEAEKTRKRELIKEIFPTVDVEELKPRQEDIDAVAETLRGYGFSETARKNLKDFDAYMDMLMWSKERGL